MVTTRGNKRRANEAVNVNQNQQQQQQQQPPRRQRRQQQGHCTATPQQPLVAIIPAMESQQQKEALHGLAGSSNNRFLGSGLLQKATSLNVTEIAEQMAIDGFDEVNSFASDSTLVSVRGYKVNLKHEALLGDILSKYGDIAVNCNLGSVRFRSLCMEIVCEIFQKLKDTNLIAIKISDLEEMLGHVEDFHRANIDIGWLKKRLNEILEAKQAVQVLASFSNVKNRQTERKSEITKKNNQLAVYDREYAIKERELKDLDKRICACACEVEALKAEYEKADHMISKNKAKLRYMVELGTLVHGLMD